MRRNRRRSRLRRVVVVVVTASSNAFRALRTTPKRTQLRRHAAAVGKYGQHGAEMTGKVAFQGEHGAYNEEAVFQHFGDAVATLPCQCSRTYLPRSSRARPPTACCPWRTQAGSINKAYDLLMDFDLRVHGETI